MRQPETSVFVQKISRPQVIRNYVTKALNRRGMLFKVYVERAITHYTQTVPEELRELKPFDTDTINGLVAAEKRISRLVHTPINDKPQSIPSELEEALVEALPEPERSEARAVLCERYGVIPVHHSELGQNKEMADLGTFIRESGEAIHQLSKVLTQTGIENMPVKEVMLARKELMDVVEAAMCIKRQIDGVLSAGGDK